jgi:uncharacterized protein YbaR (Trm112 family)
MVHAELLKLLQCPEDGSRLHEAEPELLDKLIKAQAAGTLRNRSGDAIQTPLDGGLVRADGKLLYPVLDGLPIMLVDQAILLDDYTSTSSTRTDP